MININFPPEVKVVVEHTGKTELKEISMKLDEAIEEIKAVSAQLAVAKDEIIAKITALENATGDLTPEQQAALEQLKAAAQGLDDIVPPTPEA